MSNTDLHTPIGFSCNHPNFNTTKLAYVILAKTKNNKNEKIRTSKF